MQTVLNLTASAVMLALIALLAVRAWRELIQDRSLDGASASGDIHPLAAVGLFAASLAILWLGVFIGHLLAAGSPAGFWANVTARFTEGGDAPRYLFMAENGYVREGEYVNNIVFYPLYPACICLLSSLTGISTALAGILISQLCYGMASVIFYRLAAAICRRPMAALLAFWLYPFGYFALGVYTEGLFLFLSLGCLYALMRKKWLRAGVFGLLCALTRSQGVLLLLPAVYLVLRSVRRHGWNGRMVAVIGPLLGFGVYLCINKLVCGSFFAFSYYESQPPWWQTAQWVGKTVAQQWAMAIDYADIARWIYWPQLALYFLAAAALYFGWKKRQSNALVLYGTGYLGMCYTASWLISGGRYMLGCAPMFFAVGSVERRFVRRLLLLVELGLFVLFDLYFMQGQCIM